MAKIKKLPVVGKLSSGQGGTTTSDAAAGPKPTGRSFAKVPLYEGVALKNNLDDVAKQVSTLACSHHPTLCTHRHFFTSSRIHGLLQ